MQNLKSTVKFLEWEKSLLSNNIKIDNIEEKYNVYKKNGELLFALIHLKATDNEGIPLLPMVLLRGHFVSVVTVLIDSSTNEKYFLLVKQRRVANGSIFFEHPAGMCDNEIDPYKVAIKEVMEETGLTIFKEDLHLLWDKPLYSSPGLLDEAGYFFYCEVKLDSKELNSFRNKITGAKDENEHIETFLCPSNDILKYIENSNGVLASLLYLQKSV
jgi:8-oxo-dGTP pyrophosphatase MutT (NUDIX family)